MKLTKRTKNKWDQILHRVIELKDYIKFGISKFRPIIDTRNTYHNIEKFLTSLSNLLAQKEYGSFGAATEIICCVLTT